VDVRGITNLILVVTDAGDGVSTTMPTGRTRSFWSTATPHRASTHGTRDHPHAEAGPDASDQRPACNRRPSGNPFLFRIPTQANVHGFAAESLPDGLNLDRQNGIIHGTTPARGEYVVVLSAKNRHGAAQGKLRIVAGDTLALTPTMGWNHWYTHYDRITDTLMREAADVMVSSGMADVGYQFVSIDDCWMNAEKHSDPLRTGPLRDAEGNVLPNRHFRDMRAMTDYIHGKGLKAGTYIGPGPRTCAGFVASWQHEAQDARQFAAWGFDLLKYDWCSYGEIAAKDPDPELVRLKKPYILMGNLLKQQPRDIVFNLCQYGMGKVWSGGGGGRAFLAHGGDLGLSWTGLEVALQNANTASTSGRGVE
jgi:alpha-galactosidase